VNLDEVVGAVGVEITTARDLKATIASNLESVDIDLPFVTRSVEG